MTKLSDVCFSYNATNPGSPLLGYALIATTLEQCVQFCRENTGCNYFVYHTETSASVGARLECWLKTKQDYDVEFVGAVSGPPFCDANYDSG